MKRRRPLPELMGNAEAAEALGIHSSNIDKQAGLPKAEQTLRCGRIWRAADIRKFAKARSGAK